MSDHQFYLWGAYGVFALGIAIELVLLLVRAKRPPNRS